MNIEKLVNEKFFFPGVIVTQGNNCACIIFPDYEVIPFRALADFIEAVEATDVAVQIVDGSIVVSWKFLTE